MRRKIIIVGICLLVICFLIFILVINNENDDSEVSKDEIALKIRLDTDEDIGLLVYDYTVGGNEFSGGISNADKSLMKRNSLVIQTMNKQVDFNNLSDINDLTIRFTIITEYVDPNYENIYPEELTKVIETPISLDAHYGEQYFITISGNKISGYEANIGK